MVQRPTPARPWGPRRTPPQRCRLQECAGSAHSRPRGGPCRQRGGVSLKGGVGESGDQYERHADDVADAVVAGKSAEPILDRMGGRGTQSTSTQRKALQLKGDGKDETAEPKKEGSDDKKTAEGDGARRPLRGRPEKLVQAADTIAGASNLGAIGDAIASAPLTNKARGDAAIKLKNAEKGVQRAVAKLEPEY